MRLVDNQEKINAFRERARALVAQMTLQEKVDQTLHKAPAIPRLGIKSYNWWNEALHGVARAGIATVFPQAIGMAASFDEELLGEVADAIATEGRAKFNMQQAHGDTDIYKGLTFWSPNVNIFRDPRWGRGHETYGEDPFLSGTLGVSFINGLQGDDENYLKSAACAKHFAVHSGPEDLRHSFNAEVSQQDLYETYLPAFKACVEKGKVEAVMGAYNRTNGEPCCGSKTLLQDILRDEWGFAGHVVSDCWAIKDFHEAHLVTSTPVESVSMAMNNGCDLNCGNLFHYLKQAVEEGRVPESRLDEALVNLFTARMKLGFFDEETANPYNTITYDVVDSTAMRELNLKTSLASIVLLKNDGILPLNKDGGIKTIGVIGPNANSRAALVGNYEGTAARYITVLEGIQDMVGDDIRVLTSEACHLYKTKASFLSEENDRLSEMKEVCRLSDVIIACMGLDATLEGEEGDTGNEYGSGDKPNLDLPGRQQLVLEEIVKSGKPAILIILSGSALAVNYADRHFGAVVQGWYPGAQGGKAIAKILFGENSPEGKLPLTFYRGLEDLPEFTDYNMQNRTYRYMKFDPLYPFGYGLSYADITVDEVVADSMTAGAEGINITVKVRNNSKMKAAETIQAYVKIVREDTPNAQLKGIKKVRLEAGEEKEVTIHLPRESFGLYDVNGVFVVDSGEAEIYIGGQAPGRRSEELTGKKVRVMKVNVV
ncbi:MAG: glycoside hydrolase family 3 C-terminal domain-containing protein [Lachnospiraceae bacterium]|jgi:beta-glucosidase|nr:glycoside hydrolase family 3 C-terminal domain-containing protein [Lachnospiraceae bacterium]